MILYMLMDSYKIHHCLPNFGNLCHSTSGYLAIFKYHFIRNFLTQFSSVIQLYLTLCNPMNCSMPGLPVHHQLLESTQIHVHRVSDAIQPSHPLSSPSPPALNLSSIRVFSSELALYIRWPKILELCFTISPSNEYSRLISLKIDLFDLLAVQGTLKSLLQHYNSKESILLCSAFFMVQLSHRI